MRGFISYTSDSPLSPEYPSSITISTEQGEITYSSPAEAIRAGTDEHEVMLLHVANHKERYRPYREYVFRGEYADALNDAIAEILVAQMEPIDTSKYQYMLDISRIRVPPQERTVRISRPIYLVTPVGENIYRQTRALDKRENYDVALIENVPLYIGTYGAFLLIDTMSQDVSSIVSRLEIQP